MQRLANVQKAMLQAARASTFPGHCNQCYTVPCLNAQNKRPVLTAALLCAYNQTISNRFTKGMHLVLITSTQTKEDVPFFNTICKQCPVFVMRSGAR